MITLHDLTMQFGPHRALDRVTLSIAPGESVALWGTNGAGKSTILRCVTGALRYRGQIIVNGLDARRDGKSVRQHIGYVPQELGFYDDLRCGAAIRYFGTLKGVRKLDVDATLDEVGLLGHERKRIRELSGGMKQRLALAIALLNNPSVLLLDEVTASLDAAGRGELIELLSHVRGSDQKRTLLFASHRLEEIQALATRVITLERGNVLRDESVQSFGNRASTCLHLIMPIDDAHRSVALLRQKGMDARLNGRGILVPVLAGDRAAPLRHLEGQGLRVDDLELLDDASGGVR